MTSELINPDTIQWYEAASVNAFPADGGACVKIGERQIAVFHFAQTGEWYACQNQCPHKMQMILARGLIGDQNGEPKVACPYHKKTFSLCTGENLNGDDYRIETYPVRIDNEKVYIGL
ncbi:nitrite reductase small subunit NirD [Spirosoma taeanense]|uniref:Nitrite reductase small subunit NirD n=1 Tax=Spirosoma taeanense TaxID=2735870 RepID=A0A6M5YDZ0_9BACT|nr:nitrite reductase small subunit NirD [Spirosoma taeanense]QJW91814.1 nitrite reductase small subunit NirD [Spirosoma taeanense]